MVLAALALEVVVYNFPALETASLTPVEPTSVEGGDASGGVLRCGDGQDETQVTYRFADGAQLETLELAVEGVEDAGASAPLAVDVSVVDEGLASGHSLVTETVEELERWPWIRIHPSGRVYELTVRLVDADGEAPSECGDFRLELGVAFNVPIPLDFQWGRVVVASIFLIACWLLRPTSPLYDWELGGGLVLYLVAAVLGVALALAAVANVRHALIPQNDEFDALARSLLQGDVSLDYEVDPVLAGLDNPYDPVARARSGATFLFDAAFCDGRYYMYFGPLPTLLFSLPYRLITGSNLGVLKPSCLVVFALPLALAWLVCTLTRRWMKHCSIGVALLLYIALFIGTWTPYLAATPNIYVLPNALSWLLVALALGFWTLATEGGAIRLPQAVAGSLFMALTLLSRLTWFAYAILGIVFIVGPFRTLGARRAIPRILLALIPFALVGAVAAAYNHARFGSPLDFGSAYNLTVSDLTHQPMGLQLAVLGVFAYLFQPPNIALSPEVFHPTIVGEGWNGYLYEDFPKGGTYLLFPVLLFGLLVVSRRARSRMATDAVALTWVSLGIAVLLAAVEANLAGIHARYALDSCPGIAIAFLLVVMGLWRDGSPTTPIIGDEAVRGRADGRRAFRLSAVAYCALLAVSVITFLAWWPWPWHLFEYIT